MASLYIHVPFCKRKCQYCDFSSYAGKEALIGDYFNALNAELDEVIKEHGNVFETAFVGGGTPSLPDAKYIAEIAGRIKTGEFTIEANPGTLDEKKLRAYKMAGINRISIGVQSFDDALLKKIGRIHDSIEAINAVKAARDAGFDNINIDLMYALPDQTTETWLKSLDIAVNLGVTHISAYSLIIEEGTPISTWFAGLSDDTVNQMQREATAFLRKNGFERYEISNYAKKGFECRHNMRYWTRGDYIGIGSAAHSLYKNERYSNPASIEDYIGGKRHIDGELLSDSVIREERIMLGLRTTKGIDIEENRLDKAFIAKLENAGYAFCDNGRLILTERGMEIMDGIVLELI